MPKLRLGANVTVFLLFFALATFEAFRKRNWLVVAIFLLLGVVSLFADSLVKSKQTEKR